jgi:uncharacterized protein YndB with AHSA1/START domain
MRRSAFFAALCCAAAPAAAEVKEAAPASFVLETVTTVDAVPDRVWDTFRDPRKWWNPEHSYSGDAANLYMDVQATGCFCERVPPKGSIEHARVIYIAPGQMMRLSGALGPLQAEAVQATLTFKFAKAGAGTQVTMSYVVGGYMRQGGETLAPLVDRVMAEQLTRLKAAAEAAPAPQPEPARK